MNRVFVGVVLRFPGIPNPWSFCDKCHVLPEDTENAGCRSLEGFLEKQESRAPSDVSRALCALLLKLTPTALRLQTVSLSGTREKVFALKSKEINWFEDWKSLKKRTFYSRLCSVSLYENNTMLLIRWRSQDRSGCTEFLVGVSF